MPRRSSGAFQVDGRPCGWVRDGVLKGRPLVLLAHGAGAPLTSAFQEAVAAGLHRRDCAVARFHFPYMERRAREGKPRPPDPAPRLLATWREMLRLARGWRNAGPMVLAGKSMGGRMASMLLAEETPEGVQGAVYLGYPLHPPGREDRLRSEHLPAVRVPQLFVSGTRDNLCNLELLRPVLKRLGRRARLQVVEGGDHSLATSRKAPLAGSDAWLDVVASFVHRVAGDG